jgi:hypothetical protein
MPRGALLDKKVHENFDYIQVVGARKPIAVCKCCNKYRKAKNTCRQRVYLLEECTKYYPEIEHYTQTKLPTQPKIDEVRQARLNRKLALVIYTTGQAFSVFEDPTWLDFFKELNYTLPSRTALARSLLDTTYDQYKEEVDKIIKALSALGLVIDKSKDVSLNKLANYSVLTLDKQSFYYKTKDVKEKTQNAENLVEEIMEVGTRIGGLIDKFVSLGMDTYPRNLKAFNMLSKRLDT